MFPLTLHNIIRRSEKPHIGNLKSRFLCDLTNRAFGESFAVFEMSAWTLICPCTLISAFNERDINERGINERGILRETHNTTLLVKQRDSRRTYRHHDSPPSHP